MMNGISPPLPALLLPLYAGGFGPALLWLVPLVTLVEVVALGLVIYNNLDPLLLRRRIGRREVDAIAHHGG